MAFLNDHEICEWILQNLSTPRKIISANYTRNNFEYLKKTYPEQWKQLKNRTFLIKNKSISFHEIDYTPIIINGIELKINRNYKSQMRRDLRQFLEHNSKPTFKSFLSFLINQQYRGDPLKIFQKCFPVECLDMINQYGSDSRNNREMIYRYMHDIQTIPKINNIALDFHCHTYGYLGWQLYQIIQLKAPKNDMEILDIILNNTYEMKGILYLKKFYPEIIQKLRKNYPKIALDEAAFLYHNSIDQPPKCLICQIKPCQFHCHSIGYHNYCSIKCAKTHKRIERIQREHIDYKDWRKYYHQTWRYTRISYQKFITQINPNNYPRTIGKKGYQLDHIIPITYGFLNKIDPSKIGHFLNLRIIPGSENACKGSQIILTSEEIKTHFEKIENYPEKYYDC